MQLSLAWILDSTIPDPLDWACLSLEITLRYWAPHGLFLDEFWLAAKQFPGPDCWHYLSACPVSEHPFSE